MLQRCMDLVLEFVAVDGASASSCLGRVAALNHEVWDDSVKDDIVVVTPLNQGTKVSAGLGSVLCVKLDSDGPLIDGL